MTRLLSVLVLALALTVAGCDVTRYSDVLSEPGTVDQTIHTPSTHGSGIAPVMGGNGGIVIVSVDTDPDWVVVFRCQHGKFVIHNRSEWSKRIAGEDVTIHYREVYRCPRKAPDECALVDYDFIGAEPR